MKKPLALWLGCLVLFISLTLAGLHSGSRTTRSGMAAVLGSTADGYTVVVDAGHGGEDPGAVGKRKTYEKHTHYALDSLWGHVV